MNKHCIVKMYFIEVKESLKNNLLLFKNLYKLSFLNKKKTTF